ncbi:MAG TPA: hypothetical protein VD902_07085 [Symbiobacteriaceae bacterium]|nr:hypothetical protein [Symbiobacteriaceae bacterium]
MSRLLEGVRLRHHPFSLGGALGSLLAAAGRDLPQPYVMGASGLAFRLTLDLVISPGSPAELNYHEQVALWENLGAWFKRVAARPADAAFAGARAEALHRIRESVDRGYPAIAYDLLALPEYGLAVGHEGDRLACLTLNSPSAPQWMDAAGWPPEEHRQYTRAEAITLLDTAPAFDRRKAETASIRSAVEHFWSPPSRDGWLQYGLKAYEFWIAVLTAPLPMHGVNPAMSHSYNLMVLQRLRQDAAEYLTGLAPRYPNAPSLQTAAARYRETAAALEEAIRVLPFPGTPGALEERETKGTLAETLRKAMTAERQGIEELERSLRALR